MPDYTNKYYYEVKLPINAADYFTTEPCVRFSRRPYLARTENMQQANVGTVELLWFFPFRL